MNGEGRKHDLVACVPESPSPGERQVITTLREAGELILGLPELHRANGHWQRAMECLMAAAEALDRAARQFSIALHAEGLTPFRPPGKRR